MLYGFMMTNALQAHSPVILDEVDAIRASLEDRTQTSSQLGMVRDAVTIDCYVCYRRRIANISRPALAATSHEGPDRVVGRAETQHSGILEDDPNARRIFLKRAARGRECLSNCDLCWRVDMCDSQRIVDGTCSTSRQGHYRSGHSVRVESPGCSGACGRCNHMS